MSFSLSLCIMLWLGPPICIFFFFFCMSWPLYCHDLHIANVFWLNEWNSFGTFIALRSNWNFSLTKSLLCSRLDSLQNWFSLCLHLVFFGHAFPMLLIFSIDTYMLHKDNCVKEVSQSYFLVITTYYIPLLEIPSKY